MLTYGPKGGAAFTYKKARLITGEAHFGILPDAGQTQIRGGLFACLVHGHEQPIGLCFVFGLEAGEGLVVSSNAW